MRSAPSNLSPASPGAPIGDIFSTSLEPRSGGWQEIVSKLSNYLTPAAPRGHTAPEALHQLSGLLRLQMDVTRYQLRVEVVSKVAESAVASLRKLQQSQ
ncbi:MAG: hypothetical protein RL518_844 [Pseudomonadota bacterium]